MPAKTQLYSKAGSGGHPRGGLSVILDLRKNMIAHDAIGIGRQEGC